MSATRQTPFEASQYYVPNYAPTDVQVSGDTAFIYPGKLPSGGGLGIVDVSNPLAPVVISSLITRRCHSGGIDR